MVQENVGDDFFSTGAKRFLNDFLKRVRKKIVPRKLKKTKPKYETKSFVWMRPGSHDGLALDFEALHLQWEKSVLLYVTFVISKLSAWGGTFQLSPVQPIKLVGALEEGGGPPVRKKNETPSTKKKRSRNRSERFLKMLCPSTKKKRSQRFLEPLSIYTLVCRYLSPSVAIGCIYRYLM